MIDKLFATMLFMIIVGGCVTSQNLPNRDKKDEAALPFVSIPEYPESYTTGAVLGRFIDGLGYRYYWATEGLRPEDLTFDPGGENRPPEDVLTHIYGLSETIVNAPMGVANVRPMEGVPEQWEDKRRKTLENLKKASNLLKQSSNEHVTDYKVSFQRGERISEFEYWHMINGPIADAIYHVGQITSYRRSSGNPIDPRVNVFMGKTRE